MNPRILFIASCIALVTSAFTFSVRGEILQDMGNAYQLSQEQKGLLEGAVFLGMAASMVVGGFICDLLGMKLIMLIACLCHLLGVAGTIWAPHNEWSFAILWTAAFVMGCGNGMVETGINPLVASLYPDKKTHIMNILHAWWPGGLILGGLAALYLRKGIDLGFVEIVGLNLKTAEFANWQVSLFLILIPSIIYGLIVLTQKFPETERVAAGISYGEMFREAFRPLFLILAFAMLLTAATELGPQKWQESVMQRTAMVSGTLILVYTSGMMFVLRHFAGALVHRTSPIMLLLVSSVLSAVGLYLLSTATDATTAFTYATIFGLGIAFFWPTMLGVTAERFPKGGALLLCLMGSFGNLAISQVLPQMGKIYDRESVGELKKEDRFLAAAMVRNNAINQDFAKRIDLMTQFSSDELRSLDPRYGLADARWERFLRAEREIAEKKASPEEATRIRELAWREVMLGLEERAYLEDYMLGQGLLTGNYARVEPIGELEAKALAPFAPLSLDQLKEKAELTTWQVELHKARDASQNIISALRLLRHVYLAQLTPAQKADLSKRLADKGHASAAEKIGKLQDPEPPTLTARDRKAIREVIGEMTSTLTPLQQQVREVKAKIDKAEAHGASQAFQQVSILPVILIFIFGGIYLYDRSRGGYKVESIQGGSGGH